VHDTRHSLRRSGGGVGRVRQGGAGDKLLRGRCIISAGSSAPCKLIACLWAQQL